MNSNDFALIEKELAIRLPEFYKSIMIRYPYAPKRRFWRACKHLLETSKEVIKANKELREKGYRGSRWPHHFFVIGVDELMVEFLNVESDVDEVYYIDEDDKKFSEKSLRKYRTRMTLALRIDSLKAIQEILDNP